MYFAVFKIILRVSYHRLSTAFDSHFIQFFWKMEQDGTKVEDNVKNTPGNTWGYTYLGYQDNMVYSRRETMFNSRPAHVPRCKEWSQEAIEFDKMNDFDSLRKKLPWMTSSTRYPQVEGETTKYVHHILLEVDKNFVF